MSNLTPTPHVYKIVLPWGSDLLLLAIFKRVHTSIAQRVPSSSKINFVDLRSELIPDIEPHQIADAILLLLVVCLSQNH